MNTDLLISLQITLIGISIVFLLLALTWFLIASLIQLFSKEKPIEVDERESKQKAAAIAAAIALKLNKQKTGRSYNLPPTAIVSAWQLSMRTKQLKEGVIIHDKR